MEIERKAWKSLHRLIACGNINERESYLLASAIFAVNFQYIPVPNMDEPPFPTESSVQEGQAKDKEEVTVRGFVQE